MRHQISALNNPLHSLGEILGKWFGSEEFGLIFNDDGVAPTINLISL